MPASSLFLTDIFPQTLDVIRTRAIPLGIEIVTGNHAGFAFTDEFFGGIVQYPDQFGEIHLYEDFVKAIHEKQGVAIVAADLMSLVLLTPPGEWGADVVVGSSQRFGIPSGLWRSTCRFFRHKG